MRRYRHLAQFWQEMQRQGAEPAACLAVALQLGLASLKCVSSNVLKKVQVASGFASLPLAFLDRVQPGPNLCPGSIGVPACLSQRDCGIRTQSHLAPSAVNGETQYPFAPMRCILDQLQPGAICMFARSKCDGTPGAQSVACPHGPPSG